MTRKTPIAESKTSALTRVIDAVSRGYCYYTHGLIAREKLESVIRKFDSLYGIADTPAQRITRKKHGKASALLTIYAPKDATKCSFVLQATEGTGMERENLNRFDKKPLDFLGYQTSRYQDKGALIWTWKRPKDEMKTLINLINNQASTGNWAGIQGTLDRAANQVGFHGVRTQTFRLCDIAFRTGFRGQRPQIYYVQKVSHGTPFIIEP